MSHFVVAVIHSPEISVEGLLEPYYEQPEDGDPRLVFQDVTEEVTEEYNTRKSIPFAQRPQHTLRVVKGSDLGIDVRQGNIKVGEKFNLYAHTVDSPYVPVLENGKVICIKVQKRKHDAEIYGKVTTVAYKEKDDNKSYMYTLERLPTPVPVPLTEQYESLDVFAKEYHSYKKNIDGKYGYFSNPNSKWDWWVVGGRWSGSLIAKEDANFSFDDYRPVKEETSPYSNDNRVTAAAATLMDKSKMRFDSLPLKDVDFAAMSGKTREDLEQFWEDWVEQKNPDKEEFRQTWGLYKPEYYVELYKTKEAYVEHQLKWKPYAILHETKGWLEPGPMGWFGLSHETAEGIEDFGKHLNDILYDVPEDSEAVITGFIFIG